MTEAQGALDAAMAEAERLKRLLKAGSSNQVSGDDERRMIKSTALAWFNNHRNAVRPVLNDEILGPVDDELRGLLSASDKATLRALHIARLKRIKSNLAGIQSDHVVALSAIQRERPDTSDTPPRFTSLVADPKMQTILSNRWAECVRCIEASAPLAAVVMMGGMLEGLLLARVNQLTDLAPVFKAASAPKDKSGTPLRLKDWGLTNYLDVAYELNWITRTTKDVGGVVRDYRNYIHPQKEHSHGVSLSPEDAKLLWEIAKSVARQVLKP